MRDAYRPRRASHGRARVPLPDHTPPPPCRPPTARSRWGPSAARACSGRGRWRRCRQPAAAKTTRRRRRRGAAGRAVGCSPRHPACGQHAQHPSLPARPPFPSSCPPQPPVTTRAPRLPPCLPPAAPPQQLRVQRQRRGQRGAPPRPQARLGPRRPWLRCRQPPAVPAGAGRLWRGEHSAQAGVAADLKGGSSMHDPPRLVPGHRPRTPTAPTPAPPACSRWTPPSLPSWPTCRHTCAPWSCNS